MIIIQIREGEKGDVEVLSVPHPIFAPTQKEIEFNTMAFEAIRREGIIRKLKINVGFKKEGQ